MPFTLWYTVKKPYLPIQILRLTNEFTFLRGAPGLDVIFLNLYYLLKLIGSFLLQVSPLLHLEAKMT